MQTSRRKKCFGLANFCACYTNTGLTTGTGGPDDVMALNVIIYNYTGSILVRAIGWHFTCMHILAEWLAASVY